MTWNPLLQKRRAPKLALAVAVALCLGVQQSGAQSQPRQHGELAWSIGYDPGTLDPAKADDEASALVRYLTGGVLLRVNRTSHAEQPELASSYSLSPDQKVLTFHLRPGLRFSDGSPLTARDVASSLRRLLDPGTQAPAAQEFLAPAQVQVATPDPATVRLTLQSRVQDLARVFEEIAIEPADHPSEGRVTSGPFFVSEYKRGLYIRLRRNPFYWKHDAGGTQLPYAAGVRLDLTNNREQEIALFARKEYDLIQDLPAEYFSVLSRRLPSAVQDLGPSLNTEQIWFNQAAGAPLPDYEKAWFANRAFRVAVSQALHRSDLARIAYGGHATPAFNFISPANRQWNNAGLRTAPEDPQAARRLLLAAGFRYAGSSLLDSTGHPVRFSILTNAGNAARQKMATLIQQDLLAIGMQSTVVTLDFPALVERLMHKQDYEACLLGLSNVEPDPSTMINIWLSSSPNHQWNPSEKQPATPWEAEIDRLIKVQASGSLSERKHAMDAVQQIVADQQPFTYLVYPNTLYAVSPDLAGVQPSVFQPGLVWNIDSIRPEGKLR